MAAAAAPEPLPRSRGTRADPPVAQRGGPGRDMGQRAGLRGRASRSAREGLWRRPAPNGGPLRPAARGRHARRPTRRGDRREVRDVALARLAIFFFKQKTAYEILA